MRVLCSLASLELSAGNPGANLFLVVQKEVSDDTSTKRVEVRLSGLCHPLDGRSTGGRG